MNTAIESSDDEDLVLDYELVLGCAYGGWVLKCKGDGYISMLNTAGENSIKDNITIPLSQELMSKLTEVDDRFDNRFNDANRAAAIIKTIEEYISENFGDGANLCRDVDTLVEYCKDGVIENDSPLAVWNDGEHIADIYLQDCLAYNEDEEIAQQIVNQLDKWIIEEKLKQAEKEKAEEE